MKNKIIGEILFCILLLLLIIIILNNTPLGKFCQEKGFDGVFESKYNPYTNKGLVKCSNHFSSNISKVIKFEKICIEKNEWEECKKK